MQLRTFKIVTGLMMAGACNSGLLFAGDFGFSFHYGKHSYCAPRVTTYSYACRVPSFTYYEPRTYVYAQPRTYVYTTPRTYVYEEPSAYVYADEPVYVAPPPRTYVYREPAVYMQNTPSVVVYDDAPIYAATYTCSDYFRYPSRGGRISFHYNDHGCDSHKYYRSYGGPSYRSVARVNRSCYEPSRGGLRISFGRRESDRRSYDRPSYRSPVRFDFRNSRSAHDRGDGHRGGQSRRAPTIQIRRR